MNMGMDNAHTSGLGLGSTGDGSAGFRMFPEDLVSSLLQWHR
jgi:hypothetical protein